MKIKSRKELIEELENYKNIINKDIQNMLENAINLDIFLLNDKTLNSQERENLMNLKIARDVLTYNTYYKAKEVIEKEKENFNLSVVDMRDNFNGINVEVVQDNGTIFTVFDYMLTEDGFNLEVYETHDSEIIRRINKEKICDELEELYKERETANEKVKKTIDNMIQQRIEKYTILNETPIASEEEIYKIESQRHFTEEILNDYPNEEFNEVIKDYSNMHKKLVKKLSGINIIKNIEYR